MADKGECALYSIIAYNERFHIEDENGNDLRDEEGNPYTFRTLGRADAFLAKLRLAKP